MKKQGTRPTFQGQPSIKQVGDKIVFEIILIADPAPEITWYHGDDLINSDNRHNMLMSNDGTTYTIIMELSDLEPDDGGKYKVVTKNTAGEATANLNLNVPG